MRITLLAGTAAILLATSQLHAQNAPTTTTPTTPPATTAQPNATGTKGEFSGENLKLTDQQANAWIRKSVYSADAKSVGEVGAFQRDSTGKVTELYADVGGFLGIGERRVRLMPNQFKIVDDRVVTTLSADQVRALPQIAK